MPIALFQGGTMTSAAHGSARIPSGDPAYAGRTQRVREWFASPLGAALLETERELLDAVLPNLFGYYLLQVGALARPQAVSASRIRGQICIFETPASETGTCHGVRGSSRGFHRGA